VVSDDVDDFCRATWPALAAGLGFYCHDVGVGEEIAQEALARAWARWESVRAMESPEAWVYRVALNLARSRFRRSRAERRALSRLSAPEMVTTEGIAGAVAVRAAVAALPERQRAALVLRYFADLPATAVAETLDCAPGTVRSLTSQAIDRLRREFDVATVSEDAR
jgi:RNA polymerase sigma-70 factor (ECF subfamily)